MTSKLNNPPIIEAVLDIDCDFAPGFDLAGLEKDAQEMFHEHFPLIRRQIIQTHEMELKADEQPKISTGVGMNALQLVSSDERQLIQIRNQGFSFNRLTPYSSFDNYLPQIRDTWLSFVQLTNPILTKRIGLRYINRILLPIKGDRVDFDIYFTNPPRTVDPSLVLVGFLNQYTAVDTRTKATVNSVITLQPPDGSDKLSVIFDNTCVFVADHDPSDWDWISGQLVMLRGLKNEVFEKTLTEECLNLFQQL